MTRLTVNIVGLIFISLGHTVVAQTYPAKPVRFVVPFVPGGPTDIQGRMLGEKLGQRLGQQVIIDNRGGAGGNIGMELTAKSPPRRLHHHHRHRRHLGGQSVPLPVAVRPG